MELLTFLYGIGVIVVLATIIVHGVWRRGQDLLTARNIFLMGGMLFIGVACINSAWDEHLMEYRSATYVRFFASTTLYLVVWLLVYHKFPTPSRWAGRKLLHWPAADITVLFILTPICFGIALLRLFNIPIPVFSQIAFLIGDKVAVITVALAFFAWFQARRDGVLLTILIFSILLSLVLGTYGTTGRRALLSTLMVLPLILYWTVLRYRSSRVIYTWVAIVTLVGTMGIAGYTSYRHRVVGQTLTFQTALENLVLLPGSILKADYSKLFDLDTFECSMTAIELYTSTHQNRVSPGHTLYFIAINPIPRQFFENKPKALGILLPQRDYQVYRSTVNWGPGMAGHAYFEGGILVIPIYAAMMALIIRLIDEWLLRQPQNPYVIGIFAACFGHILGYIRGDIGTFTINIISAFLGGMIVAWIGKTIAGVGLSYPETSAYPLRLFHRGPVLQAQQQRRS